MGLDVYSRKEYRQDPKWSVFNRILPIEELPNQ